MNGLRIPGWVEELALGQGEKRTVAEPRPRPGKRRTRGCGKRVRDRQVAPQQRGPGPCRDVSGREARGHPAALPSAGAAQRARLSALPCAPGACRPDVSAHRPLSATMGAMALPGAGARARGCTAAAKMAQRRRYAEYARGSPRRGPPVSRAALYVHVSGAGAGGQSPRGDWQCREATSFCPGLQTRSGTGRGALARKCPGSET